jgi:release factor glutamine methyltransferase
MRILTVPGVFRPRSDSVLLAEAVERAAAPEMRVLDLFTGSGIVAVAAARAGATVSAVDVSRRALVCAWVNARLNGARVRVRRGDMFAPLARERFDLIAANPPYVPSVSNAAPRGAARAWEAGADGRRFIDRLCREAPAHLAHGGRLLLVHSSICDTRATLEALAAAGLEAQVAERRRGSLGPLISARAEDLERRGLLAPGRRDEEVVVIDAAHRAGVGSVPAGTWAA